MMPSDSKPGDTNRRALGYKSTGAGGPPTDIAALAASVDRVGKIQLILVGVLTVALVAIPLYLWRRPRAEVDTSSARTREAAEGALAAADAGAAPASLA